MSLEAYFNDENISNEKDPIYKSIDRLFSKEQKIVIHIFIQKEITKEMAIFKDELNKKFVNYDNRMFSYVNDLENHIKELIIKVGNLFEKSNIFLAKVDKIDNLGIKVDSMNELLTYHDVRINNLIKDLSNACFKYDKIFLNNLVIPGKIGDSCKYKNLKEYLEYTFNQFIQFENFIEKQVIVLKDYKEKIDNLDNNLSRQINTLKQTNFDFINLKIEEVKGAGKEKFAELNDLIQKNKIENDSNYMNVKKELNELNNLNKISIKKEDDEIKEILKDNNLIKKKFLALSSYIKDFRRKKNSSKTIQTSDKKNRLGYNLTKDIKSSTSKAKDEQLEELIESIKEDSKKSRKNMRSLTNKSIRKFKDEEKDIKKIENNFNASSTNLPVQNYFSRLSVLGTKNKTINKSFQNIEEEINASSNISSKGSHKTISIIEYDSECSNNFPEENNENIANIENIENIENSENIENIENIENAESIDNNILIMIKKSEENIESIREETNNKLKYIEEKINSLNNIIILLQKNLFNLEKEKEREKEKKKSLVLNKKKNKSDSKLFLSDSESKKSNINDKYQIEIPFNNTKIIPNFNFGKTEICTKNKLLKKYLSDSSLQSNENKKINVENNKKIIIKGKSIYDKFLINKQKLEKKESSVLITLTDNFLKPLKSSLLNIPQIYPSKQKKEKK